MYEEKEVLTRGERFINLVYYIFRYSLYAIAWGFLGNNINPFLATLLLLVFCYLAEEYRNNKGKVLENLLAEEHYKVVQALTNPNYGKANSPDIAEILDAQERQELVWEIMDLAKKEKKR